MSLLPFPIQLVRVGVSGCLQASHFGVSVLPVKLGALVGVGLEHPAKIGVAQIFVLSHNPSGCRGDV